MPKSIFWLTNVPEIAARLKAAEQQLLARRINAQNLILSEKIIAIREAYREYYRVIDDIKLDI